MVDMGMCINQCDDWLLGHFDDSLLDIRTQGFRGIHQYHSLAGHDDSRLPDAISQNINIRLHFFYYIPFFGVNLDGLFQGTFQHRNIRFKRLLCQSDIGGKNQRQEDDYIFHFWLSFTSIC